MSFWNPFSWGRAESKDAELTIDALIHRIAQIQNTAAGVNVNPDTALRSPTVYSIVHGMSRAIAMLPFRIQQDQSDNNKRKVVTLTDHDVHRLFTVAPNLYMTPYDYWSLVIVRLLLYGEFFAEKRTTTRGRVAQLMPVMPTSVETRVLASGRIEYDVVLPDNTHRTVGQNAMQRIVMMSKDGIRGTSPIAECSNSIALEIAAEEFGSTVFGSGAIPNGIITRTGHFKDEADQKRFAKQWNDAFRKKRGTAVLEEGWKFEPTQMSNEDSQFLETRKHQRSVIAGAYGIPPHKVGDLERATFSNIEQMSLDFVINAMRPYLTASEQSVNRDFLTQPERDNKVTAKFVTSDFTMADMKTRSESLRIQRDSGVISANEWRALEGMDARTDEGGDDYITPLNFRVEDASGDAGGDPDDTDKSGDSVVVMRRIK